jgi:hypothetical protein
MASTATYYIDTVDFTAATAVWTDSYLTTKAPDGYYVFDGNYRLQFFGTLMPGVTSCYQAGNYKGVLVDYSIVSNAAATYSIQEFGPYGGYERLTLSAGETIKEYNWAPTVLCSDTPVSTFTVPEGGITFAKYAVWNNFTITVAGEFWMDATVPSTGTTWISSAIKKYDPLEICI